MHFRMHAVLLFEGGRETRTNHDGVGGGEVHLFQQNTVSNFEIAETSDADISSELTTTPVSCSYQVNGNGDYG